MKKYLCVLLIAILPTVAMSQHVITRPSKASTTKTTKSAKKKSSTSSVTRKKGNAAVEKDKEAAEAAIVKGRITHVEEKKSVNDDEVFKSDRVSDAFGKGPKIKDSLYVNVSTGAMNGNASFGGGLVGYTVEHWGRPHSRSAGTITIRVTVNPRGKVIKATYAGGTGDARNDSQARRSCIEAAKQSQFSVPLNRTTDGVGTITWRFI